MKNEKPAVLDIESLPGGRNILQGLPPLARMVLARECLSFLAEHPGLKRAEITRASHELWARVREVVYDPESGATLGLALAAPEPTPVILLLTNVLGVLLAQGTAEATLLAERARIDGALAQLHSHAPTSSSH